MPENVYYSDHALYAHNTYDAFPDPQDFYMHTHDRFEILLFLSGKAQFAVEGRVYDLAPGDVLITRAAEAHRMWVSPDAPYARMSIHFSPDLLSRLDPQGALLSPFLLRPLGEGNRFPKEDFGAMPYRTLLENAFGAQEEGMKRTVLLSNLFAFLCLLYDVTSARAPAVGKDVGDPIIAEVIAYINTHLTKELSLADIASRVFLSPAYLNKRFTKATGSSVWQYITIKRLHRARDRIRNGGRLGAVSLDCGYRDYSSFYRAYCKRFGHAPAKDSPGHEKEGTETVDREDGILYNKDGKAGIV